MISRRKFCALLPAAVAAPAATWADGTGALDARVTSEGGPAPARLYITGEDGHAYLVSGEVTFSAGYPAGRPHSIIDGGATTLLKPGRYTVRAERGAEFDPAEKVVTVAAGGRARVDLDVRRFFDMNAHGWYSADMHIHRKADEMPLLARAEDLNFAPVLTRHLGCPHCKTQPPYPKTNLDRVDARHIVTLQNQEVERSGLGAVLLLNTPRPIDLEMTPLWPMDVEFSRQARREGGWIDAEKPLWKYVPVNAAFGLIDSVGVVPNHFHPHDVILQPPSFSSMDCDHPQCKTPAGFAEWIMDLYYRLLNCGFPVPASAGSASGIMSSWPGFERVYVHLSGPFSMEQWFRDLKAGRSVATNGPLMLVSLNGKLPGARLPWEKPTRVKLSIDVRSQRQIERVEIVFNGDVTRTIPVNSGHFHEDITVEIGQAGWLAVRCFEPVTDTVRYAHTSPFYFPRGGKLPVRKADALEWAEVVRGIAASLQAEQYPSQETYLRAQATFRKAEEIYRGLAR